MESSWLGMRAIGVMSNASAARTMCSTSPTLMEPCSQSRNTKSKSSSPSNSTISGEKPLTMPPRTTLPSASFCFVVLTRIGGLLGWALPAQCSRGRPHGLVAPWAPSYR